VATAIGSYITAALLKAQLGISDSGDDTVLGYVCDRVNQFIETKTRRVLAPVTSATYYFDVERPCRELDVTQHVSGFTGGLRAASAVEVATHTGAAYVALPAGDYFLREPSGPAMPFDVLMLSDIPTGGYSRFPAGFATVKVTATAGPAAIPDDIIEVASTVATRAWGSIQSMSGGDSSVVGTDAMGVIVTRSFFPKELDILRAYTRGRDLG
jgi:hypothetical protein